MTHVSTQPVPVEVVNHPEPKRFEVRAAYRSIVLTANNPSAEIAGYDPLRECIEFSPAANAYVISGSVSQANDPNNLAATIVNPNGRYIPANAGFQVTTTGQNDVWVSTGTYPTIVGFQIIRKVPE